MAHHPQPKAAQPWRDAAILAVVTALVAAVCVRFELSEALFAATRRWEHLQLDELPAVLLALVLCLVWFAARRYGDALAELARRRAAEGELARTLAENRRLAQEYLRVQESERKHLARELHDELGQYLNAIKTDAVRIQDNAGDQSSPVTRAAAAIVAHADHVHGVVRDLIRRLRPVGLEELGLSAALEHCLDYWKQRLPQVEFAVSLQGDLDRLGEERALAVYRLVQEGLSNVSSHAAAHSVRLRIACPIPLPDLGDAVVFEIADDGRGAALSGKESGLGLVGMRERVEMFGGRLRLDSTPGAGFSIVAQIPC
jgi:two-component system, NarL family, sensor histidine kinase UhpB